MEIISVTRPMPSPQPVSAVNVAMNRIM